MQWMHVANMQTKQLTQKLTKNIKISSPALTECVPKGNYTLGEQKRIQVYLNTHYMYVHNYIVYNIHTQVLHYVRIAENYFVDFVVRTNK